MFGENITMKLFSLFIILLVPLPLFSQPGNRISDRQKQRLDAIATQDVPPQAPGIATAIIQNGEVIYEKYAGFANLSDSTLINSNTRFNIASNGKQFTALAILTLIDQQKLQLSDDIRKWFPRFLPAIKEKITIRSLLNHTSGIRDCYDLWSLQGYTWWEKSFDNREVLNLLEKQSDLNFPSGSRYLYSNSNYILLALLIEKVTGETFLEYTHKMFKELNMPHTSFADDFTKIQGPMARPYFNFGKWTTFDWVWNVCGDGNLFSTLEDQIQWEKLIQGKAISAFKKEIIAQSQQIMRNSKHRNYGYGLEFGRYKDLEYSFHEGATGAWKATVIRFSKKNVSFVTLTNTGKSVPSMQTRQMADVLFGLRSNKEYLTTKPKAVGRYVSEEEILGTYLTESDFAFTFDKIEGKIILKRSGRNDIELEREANNIFHQTNDPAFKQEFTTNSTGDRQVTAYYINHSPYTLTKANQVSKGFDYTEINGAYVNPETDATMDLRYRDGVSYEIVLNKGDTLQGILVSDTKMLAGFFSLERNEGGLLLNGERIKQVRFVQK
jgi:CubicO group peptidase (beta-lactamase class C family)